MLDAGVCAGVMRGVIAFRYGNVAYVAIAIRTCGGGRVCPCVGAVGRGVWPLANDDTVGVKDYVGVGHGGGEE